MHHLIAYIATLMFAAAAMLPTEAFGKGKKDSSVTIYCESGARVKNANLCKEYGGNR
jgi:hypothetical protein